MIVPGKHDNPQETVVAVTATILGLLLENRTMTYEALRERVLRIHPRSSPLLPFSLTLAFALGRIRYRPNADAFEYLEPS